MRRMRWHVQSRMVRRIATSGLLLLGCKSWHEHPVTAPTPHVFAYPVRVTIERGRRTVGLLAGIAAGLVVLAGIAVAIAIASLDG